MKFTIEKDVFKKVLSTVRIAQGSGGNNEWAKGIKISTDGDLIKLSATDTFVGISAVIKGAKIEEQGSLLFDADFLDKITGMYIDSEFSIEYSDNIVKMKSGKDSGEYPAMQDDFSEISAIGLENWFSMPKELFLFANDKVSFAACKDNGARPKMQAIYFNVKDNLLEIVACDGHKLAKLEVPFEIDVPDFNILVKVDFLAKISKAIKEMVDTDTIDLCVTEDKLYIKSGDFIVFSNLLDTTYINYNRIIPTTEALNFKISFERKELIRKIGMAGLASSLGKDNSEIIGIKVADEGFGEGFMTIVNAKNTNSKQVGEISVIKESGEITEDFCIWVNYTHLTHVLKSFESDKVYIDFVDSNNPFIATDIENDKYLTLIMPKTKKKKS